MNRCHSGETTTLQHTRGLQLGVESYNARRANCCPERGVHEFIYNLLFVNFIVVVVAHFIVTAPVVALIFTLAFRFRFNYCVQKYISFLFRSRQFSFNFPEAFRVTKSV